MHTMRKSDWRCENSLVNGYDSYALGWLLFIAYLFSIFLFHIILYFSSPPLLFMKIFTDVKPSDAFPFFPPLYCEVSFTLNEFFFRVENGNECAMKLYKLWGAFIQSSMHSSFLPAFISFTKLFLRRSLQFCASVDVVRTKINKVRLLHWLKGINT